MVLVSDFVPPGSFMAFCEVCVPLAPMTFDEEKARDAWAAAHAISKRHQVICVNGPQPEGETETASV